MEPSYFKRIFSKNLTPILAVSAFICVILTYFVVVTSNNPIGSDFKRVITLLLLDLIVLLLFITLVVYKLVKLKISRKRRYIGSSLQVRIVKMFTIVSIIPAILVATFSTLFFNYGIQSWFNDKISTVLNESLTVAEAYLNEHKNNIIGDALAMAHDLNDQGPSLLYDKRLLQYVVITQSEIRNLTEAIVFTTKGILAKSRLSFAFDFEGIAPSALAKANTGSVVILTNKPDNKVRALVKLQWPSAAYLLVGRVVNSRVLAHLQATRGANKLYRNSQINISSLQIQFSIIFILVSLLLLLVTTWMGINFASKLVRPIVNLILVTERVQAGNLSTRFNEQKSNSEEMLTLGQAFNRMIIRLEKQTIALLQANKDLDERRIFIETILAGISSGVLVLDRDRYIKLCNPSAQRLLCLTEDSYNSALDNINSEMTQLVQKHCNDFTSHEIQIINKEQKINLLVKIHQIFKDSSATYIITFDDISQLVIAQRTAAWTEIARRIAHEIKNPITPIYLAAQRIREKYSHEIKTDPLLFEKYLTVITKHVKNISTIIDEFTYFTRMPVAKFAQFNICKLLQEAVFSSQLSFSNIRHNSILPTKEIYISADENQLHNAFINILKNACESIITQNNEQKDITITLIPQEKKVKIVVQDSGSGFPVELLNTITEPYVTTKHKGVGLGLSIVKKIIDEHKGEILFTNNHVGGVVEIILPV